MFENSGANRGEVQPIVAEKWKQANTKGCMYIAILGRLRHNVENLDIIEIMARFSSCFGLYYN